MFMLDGTAVKMPHSMPITVRTIRKKTELASGKTVSDIKARKKVLNCKYNVIREDDLQTILDVITQNEFFDVTYDDAGGENTITAYVDGDVNGEPRRPDVDEVMLWENVSFTLVEQ